MLQETGRIISDFLGIRIQLRINARRILLQNPPDECIVRFQWPRHRESAMISLEKQAVCDAFGLLAGDMGKDGFSTIMIPYAHAFSNKFSEFLTATLSQPWNDVNVTCCSSAGLDDMPEDTENSPLFIDVFGGNRFLLQVKLNPGRRLIRNWRESWSESRAMVRSKGKPKDFKQGSVMRQTPQAGSTRELDRMETELPVSAELGQAHIQMKKIMDLGPGDVLNLDKLHGDPVDLYVENKKFAEGRIIERAGKISIEVTALIGSEERYRRLRGPL